MFINNNRTTSAWTGIVCLWVLSFYPCLAYQQDLWGKMNAEFRLSIPPTLKKETKRQVDWHKKNPNAIKHMSGNAQYYLGFVLTETSKRKLPSEIALIPFVESNYDPFATSSKGATGLWQIMPEMASARKLTINKHLDERRHVIKSTEAALDHLEYLYNRLDNRWDYAIAAYNAGEGRVRQAVKQAKKHKQPWTTFLPDETKKYLPKIYALSTIIKDPNIHPNALPRLPYHTYFNPTPVKHAVAFQQVAQQCQIDSDLLHKLNPEWKGHLIHKDNDTQILLPKNMSFTCQKKLNKKALFNKSWIVHQVKKNDSLKSIAKRYQTTTNAIIQYNDLGTSKLQPGSQLVIKPKAKKAGHLSSHTTLNKAIKGDIQQGPKQITHHVNTGETIHQISEKYQVKTAHIAYWNNLRYPYSLTTGKELIIWKHPPKDLSQTKQYIVQPGDSLWSIAKKHNTSVQKLQQANSLTDVNKLKLKQVIKIQR